MLARGAGRWILLALAVPVAALLYSPEASAVGLVAPATVAVFFRDPDRRPEGDGVLSPADGKVSVVRSEDGRVRVGVFMNLYDVHVNRSPVSGVVGSVERQPGGHLPAFTKESERNERVVTEIGDIRVVQIAGAVARRITTYRREGDEFDRGERMGLIAFSSRVDVVLPEGYSSDDLLVGEGSRVRAGETVIAPEEPTPDER